MRKIFEQLRLVWLVVLPLAFSLPYYFVFPTLVTWLLFTGGCVLGAVLLIADEKFGYQWYREAGDVAVSSDAMQLVTRSLVFVGVYIPLAFFIITSSGSPLGMGLVMGIGLGLALEMWLWGVHPELFQQRFGWQINHHFSATNVQQVTALFAVVLVVLSMLVAFI